MQFKSRRMARQGMNLTPLIDVVFILLIFFMLTSTFVREEGLAVALPTAATGTSTPKDLLTILIKKDGSLWSSGKELSEVSLRISIQKYLEQASSPHVVLQPDASVNVQTLIHVMDLCRGSGATQLTIATQSEVL